MGGVRYDVAVNSPKTTYEHTVGPIYCESAEFVALCAELQSKLGPLLREEENRAPRFQRQYVESARDRLESLEAAIKKCEEEISELTPAAPNSGRGQYMSAEHDLRERLESNLEDYKLRHAEAQVEFEERERELRGVEEEAAHKAKPGYRLKMHDGRLITGRAEASEVLSTPKIEEAESVLIFNGVALSDNSGYTITLTRDGGLHVSVYSTNEGLYSDLYNCVAARALPLRPAWLWLVSRGAISFFIWALAAIAVIRTLMVFFPDGGDDIDSTVSRLVGGLFAGMVITLLAGRVRLMPDFVFKDKKPASFARFLTFGGFAVSSIILPLVLGKFFG